MRRKRILFARFVARMKGMRLPNCLAFGELVRGARAAWGGRKKGGRRVPWTTSELSLSMPTGGRLQPRARGMAQDGGETKGRTFRGKIYCCRECQGWTTTCSSMLERDEKDQARRG